MIGCYIFTILVSLFVYSILRSTEDAKFPRWAYIIYIFACIIPYSGVVISFAVCATTIAAVFQGNVDFREGTFYERVINFLTKEV
jgi:hypothetical protein